MDNESVLRAKCPRCGQWCSTSMKDSAWKRFKERPSFTEEFIERDKAESVKKHGKIIGGIESGFSEFFWDSISLGLGVYNAAAKAGANALCSVCEEELFMVKPSLDPETYTMYQQEIKKAHQYSQTQKFDPQSIDNLISLSKFSLCDDEQNLKKAFERLYGQFILSFLEIPPYQRRYIMFTRNPVIALPDKCLPLPFNNIPKGIVFFENQLPEENCLYVVHPYRPNMYIPYDDYDVILFKDEMTEFLDLMSKLGAKTIEFDGCIENKEYTQEEKHSTEKLSGKVGKKKKSLAEGNVESSEDHFYNEYRYLKNTYSEKKEYKVGRTYPYVPKEMFWLEHRRSWNNEIIDRLEGRSFRSEFDVEIKTKELVSQKDQERLGIEISYLDKAASLSSERHISKQLRKHHTLKSHIKVEFYPLECFSK